MTQHPIRKNYIALAALYVAGMAWVWFGVFFYSGAEYINLMLLQAAGFLVLAGLFLVFATPFLERFSKFELVTSKDSVGVALMLFLVVLIVMHWAVLGEIPLLSAFATADNMDVALIRESIQHTGVPFVNYIPTLVVKAGVPFLAIFFIAQRRFALAWTIMAVGLVYGASLMEKSYPVFMLVPPALYCLLTKRWIRSLFILAFAMAVIMLQVVAANPVLRPAFVNLGSQDDRSITASSQDSEAINSANSSAGALPSQPGENSPATEPAISSAEAISRIVSGLTQRILFTPGSVVSKWFDTFPQKFEFNQGCGYRFVAPLRGCEFTPNALRVYALYYPEYVERGLQGSMNASHFAEEYANFGPLGLVLSGILAAGVLAVAAFASSRAGLAGVIAFNFPYIMALSSTALHTTLLSGGWALMLLLVATLFSPVAPSRPIALPAFQRGRGLFA